VTTVQARTKIRELSRVTDFSINDVSLDTYLEKALDQLADDVDGFPYRATVSLSGAATEYAAPEAIDTTIWKEIDRIFIDSESQQNWRELRQIAYEELTPTYQVATPRYWTEAEDYVYIAPAPADTTSFTVSIHGKTWRYQGAAITLGSTLPMPRSLEMPAIWLAAHYLSATNDDDDRAQRNLMLYTSHMRNYRTDRANENAKIGFPSQTVNWRDRPYMTGPVS